MTHTRPLHDSEGAFSAWTPTDQPCPRPSSHPAAQASCRAAVEYRTWESHDGAYEDYQYRCADGHMWWADGIDS